MRINLRQLFLHSFLFLAFVTTVSAQSGVISGKLTYPGEGIPRDTVLCVQTMGSTYCSNTRSSTLKAANITFRVNLRAASYDVRVPAGTYQIYAITSEMPGHKAYYNEFVRCGMSVDCRSKRPITLKVVAGRTLKGITVGDFWD